MSKVIDFTIKIRASPKDVYDTLMDSTKHSEFTNKPAEIENKEGGKFTAYGGALEGITLSFKPNKQIIQKWRARSWKKDVYSEVTYDLSKDNDSTVLVFHQTGVPDDAYEDIKKGWEMMYWSPIKTYLEK